MMDLEEIGYFLYMTEIEKEKNKCGNNDKENAEADGLRNAEATRSPLRNAEATVRSPQKRDIRII